MLLDPDAVVTRGSTLDNQRNLAAGVVQELRRRYEGTRLGRQELHAEVLEDVEGALWTLDTIDAHRLQQVPADVQLVRIVVAIDPAVTATEESDETGIVVAALGSDDRCYVLQDLSGRMPATEWARVAVDAYHQHSASRIVAEVNQGGDLVESVLRTVDRSVAYRGVRASRGKAVRAEPVASLYEQGRVCHVGNAALAQLEDQLTSWVPGLASPDRLDALVWALTDLALGAQAASFAPHHESTHTAQRLRRERAALGTRSTRLGSGSF
jgi:predicted phage terminase large subunit-like protein